MNPMLFMAAHPKRALVQPHPSVVTRHCRAPCMHATRSKNVVVWAATSVACTLRLSFISRCNIGHSLTGLDQRREAADAAQLTGTTVPTRNDKPCGEILPGEAVPPTKPMDLAVFCPSNAVVPEVRFINDGWG